MGLLLHLELDISDFLAMILQIFAQKYRFFFFAIETDAKKVNWPSIRQKIKNSKFCSNYYKNWCKWPTNKLIKLLKFQLDWVNFFGFFINSLIFDQSTFLQQSLCLIKSHFFTVRHLKTNFRQFSLLGFLNHDLKVESIWKERDQGYDHLYQTFDQKFEFEYNVYSLEALLTLYWNISYQNWID